MVKFDPTKKQNNNIIKSIFRKMVGDYKIFDDKQDEAIFRYFGRLILQHKGIMFRILQATSRRTSDGNHLTIDRFFQMFVEMWIPISNDQKEHVIRAFYNHGANLQHIMWLDFFKVYEFDNPFLKQLQDEIQKEKEEEERKEAEEKARIEA